MVEITLDEYKKSLVELLRDFHKFCEENNLKYTLYCGTLLGAIRHKGFIPWDDDLDVGMPLEDYFKFLELAKANKLPFPAVYPDEKGTYYNYFSKIFNKDITLEFGDNSNIGATDYYAYIDVFPLINLGSDVRVNKKYTRINKLLIMYHYKSPKSKGNFKDRTVFFIKYVASRLYGAKRLIKLNNKLLKENAKYVNATNVGDAVDPMSFPKKCLDEFILVPFEDGEFYALKDYDTVLTGCYGDYMTPPPVEKRVPMHSFKAYKK